MSKKILTLALACLCALAQSNVCAARQAKGSSVEQLRAGLDAGARVTLKLKDGTRRRGRVAERRETEFVLRDEKTGASQTIAYADVTGVEIKRDHKELKHGLIAAGAVVGGTLLFGLLLAAVVVRD